MQPLKDLRLLTLRQESPSAIEKEVGDLSPRI